MLKTFLISGVLSLGLAGALYYEHKALTATTAELQTTRTTVTQQAAAITEIQLFQVKTNERLDAVESRKQDFRARLGTAVAANPADAARVTPPAIVSELCAFARCRDQAPVNKAGR